MNPWEIEARRELVLEVVNLKDLLHHYLGANKQGRWVCPFHDKGTPSLTVKGRSFRCMECGETGDAIDFLMKYFGANHIKAIECLEAVLGLKPSFAHFSNVAKEIRARKIKAAHEKEVGQLRWQELCKTRDELRSAIRSYEGHPTNMKDGEPREGELEWARARICDIETEMALFYEQGEA